MLKSAPVKILVFATAIGLGVVPASAQKQAAPNYNVGDPNERICQSLTIVGSRLAVKRVCATRAEWAERKREDRQVIDQAQQGRHCGAKMNGGFAEGSSC